MLTDTRNVLAVLVLIWVAHHLHGLSAEVVLAVAADLLLQVLGQALVTVRRLRDRVRSTWRRLIAAARW